ncbi:hypothetical protein K456DRAFT_466539 [Colletotrichum gloeosporioides 23]|nr:hypothetical protein K456DRAFT_466539 [Colletotrichum gloeosporioides 23]
MLRVGAFQEDVVVMTGVVFSVLVASSLFWESAGWTTANVSFPRCLPGPTISGTAGHGCA